MKHIVLQLAGWLNSGPTHWQSIWETRYGDQRVQQLDWVQPLRGDWQIALQEHMWALQTQHATETNAAPVRFVLVGHSLGCHLISTWASHSPHVDWVVAALLVAPPDLGERSRLPAALRPWSPPVLLPLPFPSVLVSSDDDPYASAAASRQMAQAWGSRHQCLNGLGHLNAESGLGDWPAGRAMLDACLHAAREE